MLNRDFMLGQIQTRFEVYADELKDPVHEQNAWEGPDVREAVLEKAQTCHCDVISYEEWIAAFPPGDLKEALDHFREDCYRFNRIQSNAV